MPAPTLIFVRHGETDWNVESRLQGQRNIPLNARGRMQAARNGAELLRAIPGVEGYDFVASPLDRAGDTMRIMRRAMGLDPDAFRVERDLIEITFGDWEGFTLAELAATGSPESARRQLDKWSYVPPRGESYAMLAERVQRWLDGLRVDTVAVSHGAVGRVLQGILFGLGPEAVPHLPSPQDQFLVWRDGAGTWV